MNTTQNSRLIRVKPLKVENKLQTKGKLFPCGQWGAQTESLLFPPAANRARPQPTQDLRHKACGRQGPWQARQPGQHHQQDTVVALTCPFSRAHRGTARLCPTELCVARPKTLAFTNGHDRKAKQSLDFTHHS